jgi:hypothetical protein
MTSHLLALAASLALLAGCTSGGKPDDRPRRAVVTGVDQERRLVTLKGDDGRIVVLPIGEESRDFDKLRVGDSVIVSYTEAIGWQVKPSDKGVPGTSARETLSNPKPGESPGGAIERAITIPPRSPMAGAAPPR